MRMKKPLKMICGTKSNGMDSAASLAEAAAAPAMHAMELATMLSMKMPSVWMRKLPCRFMPQYVQHKMTRDWSMESGPSSTNLDQKYDTMPYVPVAYSRMKMGRSSGNSSIMG